MQRGSNPPILWRPPILPLFFKFVKPPFPCCLQPPSPLLFLLPCFFDWMGDWATFDVVFYLMILWIYLCRLRTFVSEGSWYMFLLAIWFNITHTNTDKHTHTYTHTHTHTHIHTHTHTHTYTHTKTYSTLCGPVDWHNYINIYVTHLLCAHNSYPYYVKWLNE